MCGIAGIIQSSSYYTIEHVQKMTGALQHRSPNGEQCWQNDDKAALFGHGRLSIIDLSAPLVNLCITLTGIVSFTTARSITTLN